MKEKSNSATASIPDVITYSPETKHLFDLEDQILFETIDKMAPTQPKYYKGQKRIVIEETKKIFASTPDTPIRQVIVSILTELPNFLPADNLVKVVTCITETWLDCQKSKQD